MTCPPVIEPVISDAVRELPTFESESIDVPEVVKSWQSSVDPASMMILVSAEYVKSIPCAMKNAVDWLAGGVHLMDKPLAFPNLSFRADAAYSQMTEILQIPSCKIMTDCSPKATLENPLFNSNVSEYENITIPEFFNFFQHLWENIV
ncbi:FMN reductase [Pantoea sp. Eser]|nr:FMN reductase [Pantoea sp. Eser]